MEFEENNQLQVIESIIKSIIKDSNFLSKLTENIEDSLIEFIYNLPNIRSLDNIIKLYKI